MDTPDVTSTRRLRLVGDEQDPATAHWSYVFSLRLTQGPERHGRPWTRRRTLDWLGQSRAPSAASTATSRRTSLSTSAAWMTAASAASWVAAATIVECSPSCVFRSSRAERSVAPSFEPASAGEGSLSVRVAAPTGGCCDSRMSREASAKSSSARSKTWEVAVSWGLSLQKPRRRRHVYSASPLDAAIVCSGPWGRSDQFANVVGATPARLAIAERVHCLSSRSGTRSFTAGASHNRATRSKPKTPSCANV
jgi:hypothetical protein